MMNVVVKRGKTLLVRAQQHSEYVAKVGAVKMFSAAAAEPMTNDKDYEKFSSDASRAHVTVRMWLCVCVCVCVFLNTWYSSSYLRTTTAAADGDGDGDDVVAPSA